MSTPFSGQVKTAEELAEQTTIADSEFITFGTKTFKKIKFTNLIIFLKEKLGINELNRKIDALQGFTVEVRSYTNLTIDGKAYSGTTEVTFMRLQPINVNRIIYIGFVTSSTNGEVWGNYINKNKLIIQKGIDGKWTDFTSI